MADSELFDYKFTAETTSAISQIDSLILKLRELNDLASSVGRTVAVTLGSTFGGRGGYDDAYGYGDSKGAVKATNMRQNVETRREALEILNQDLNTTKNISNYASEIVAKKVQESQVQKEVSESLAKNEKYVQNIIEKKKADKEISDKIKNAIKDSSDATEDWLKRLSSIAISFATIRKLANLFTDVVKISSDYVENLNLAEVAFGTHAEEMVSWALEFSDNMGLANTEIVKTIANFKILANTVGLADDVGTSVSKTLTQIGYDLGSLRNIDFESLFTSLQSVIYSGQVRVGYRLGLDISEESLNQLLEDLNIDTTIRKLSQSDKVLLRFIKTMKSLGEDGANVFGDLSKTISSLANRVRVFQGSMENLGLAIGDYISPYLAEIVGYANAFIQAITAILRTFKPQSLETGFQNISDDVEDATDSVEKFNDSVGLLPFDKFETLGGSSSSDDSAFSNQLAEIAQQYADEYANLSENFAKYDEQVNDIKNKIIQWVFPLSEINEETGDININTEKLGDVFSGVLMAISSIGVIAAQLIGLKLISKISDTVSVIGKLFSVLKNVNPLLSIFFAIVSYGYITNEDFRNSVNDLLSVLLELTKSVLNPAIDILNTIVPIVTDFIDILVPIMTLIVEISSAIITFVKDAGVLEGLLYAIAAAIAVVTIAVKLNGIAMLANPTTYIIMLIVAAIVALITIIKKLYDNWNEISKGISDSAKKIANVFISLGEAIVNFFISAINVIIKAINALASPVSKLSKLFGGDELQIKQIDYVEFEKISLMAKGGIPSYGSLFVAGESGAELVSNINGKTNVINKEQLSDIVYEAFMKANYNNSTYSRNQLTANLVVDGKIIARACFNDIENEGKRKYGVGWK